MAHQFLGPLCLRHLYHCGCLFANCKFSHAAAPESSTFGPMMWLVVTAAGGLKTGPLIPPAERPALIADFRRRAALKRGHGALSQGALESGAAAFHPLGPQLSSNPLSTSTLTHEPLLAKSGTPDTIRVFGEQCRVLDLGEKINGRTGHCVILSLAAAVDAPPADLLKSFELEAEASLRAYREFTPPKISWSAHQALKHAHDFRAAALAASTGDTSATSFDIHLARFFLSALFSSRRLVLLVHTPQGVKIHVITGRLFEQGCRPESTRTACFFLSEGHCQLFNPGVRFGGASTRSPFKKLCSDAGVDAWLATAASHGLIARHFQQHDPAADSSAMIPTVSLGACTCCGLPLNSRFSAAGRVTASIRVSAARPVPDDIGCQVLTDHSISIGAGWGDSRERLIKGVDECDTGTHASTGASQTMALCDTGAPWWRCWAMNEQTAREGGPAREKALESARAASGRVDEAGEGVEASAAARQAWLTRNVMTTQADYGAISEPAQGHASAKSRWEQRRHHATLSDMGSGEASFRFARSGGGHVHADIGGSGSRFAATWGFPVGEGREGARRQVVDLRAASR